MTSTKMRSLGNLFSRRMLVTSPKSNGRVQYGSATSRSFLQAQSIQPLAALSSIGGNGSTENLNIDKIKAMMLAGAFSSLALSGMLMESKKADCCGIAAVVSSSDSQFDTR